MGYKSAPPKSARLFIPVTAFFLLLHALVFGDNIVLADLTEMSIEELMNVTVYGASKFEQKTTEAPSSVSIITSEDIKKYGYRTLSDILKSQRSFYITYDRNYSYVGVRGFGRSGDYNGRVLILIDGHRTNDNVYDQGFIGTEFPLDVDLIEKIEIVRGPGSALYGSNAFFAVINVITRKAGTTEWMEASVDAGALETYKGRLSFVHEFNDGTGVLLSGSIMDSEGRSRLFFSEFDDPSTNDGIAENADYDRNHGFFLKLSRSGFTLEGLYASREKGIPTASFETDFNDSRNMTVDERGYAYLRYERQLGDNSQIMGRLFYDVYDYDGTYMYGGVTNKDLGKGTWWGGETLYSVRPLDKHKLSLGAEYQVNSKQDQKYDDQDPLTADLDDRRDSRRLAVYLQDEFAVTESLIFNAGLRHDNYYRFESTNPRLALIYSPFDGTVFKAIYGQAFRIPNSYELYYEEATTQKSNEDLGPETIRTHEIIWEQSLGKNFNMTVDAFHYTISDLIHQHSDPEDDLLVFMNSNDIETDGVELEIGGNLGDRAEGRVSYTYQNAKEAEERTRPVNSPRHLAKLNLTAPVLDENLIAGLEAQYTSKRETLAGDQTDAFIVSNLTILGRNLARGLELSGSIYNIFDKRYHDPSGDEYVQDFIEQDGRAFRLKITYVF
ncbi:MAG: TonB-dependent receptor [Nitrospirae bacterium]|nr:TonB-dependent receptor [Nitrospirota bacterium]